MPKRDAQPRRGCSPDQFAGAGDLERRAADDRGKRAEIGGARRLDRAQHDSRAADADIDRAFGLAGAVKSAGHERIVFDGIAEYDQLGAADRVFRAGQRGRALDNAAHGGDRVHVQAGARRADIDRGADALGRRQRLGNGGKQIGVDLGHAFLDMRGEAADEIDIDVVRGAIERFGEPQQILRAGAAGDQGNRRHRDAVVDDRQPEFLGDVRAHPAQVAGDPLDLVVDVAAQPVRRIAHAVEQADADGDGADIELLGPHHGDGFEDLLAGEVEMSHGWLGPWRRQSRSAGTRSRTANDRCSSFFSGA